MQAHFITLVAYKNTYDTRMTEFDALERAREYKADWKNKYWSVITINRNARNKLLLFTKINTSYAKWRTLFSYELNLWRDEEWRSIYRMNRALEN